MHPWQLFLLLPFWFFLLRWDLSRPLILCRKLSKHLSGGQQKSGTLTFRNQIYVFSPSTFCFFSKLSIFTKPFWIVDMRSIYGLQKSKRGISAFSSSTSIFFLLLFPFHYFLTIDLMQNPPWPSDRAPWKAEVRILNSFMTKPWSFLLPLLPDHRSSKKPSGSLDLELCKVEGRFSTFFTRKTWIFWFHPSSPAIF